MGSSVGDPLPVHCTIIEVRVRELRQLFNAIDPSPFHDRDLDPAAEEFITNWALEAPAAAPIGLLVYLEGPAPALNEADVLREAVRKFFGRRGDGARRRLRELFRRGRISLVIGLAFLGLSSVLATAFSGGGLTAILREGVLIGGWVGMWRPLEVFLYDWWPIRAEAVRFDRLAGMPVRIQYAG